MDITLYSLQEMKNSILFKNILTAIIYLVFFNSLYLYYHGLEAYKYFLIGTTLFIIQILVLLFLSLRHLVLKNYKDSKKWGIVALTVILTYFILRYITGEINLFMHQNQM